MARSTSSLVMSTNSLVVGWGECESAAVSAWFRGGGGLKKVFFRRLHLSSGVTALLPSGWTSGGEWCLRDPLYQLVSFQMSFVATPAAKSMAQSFFALRIILARILEQSM